MIHDPDNPDRGLCCVDGCFNLQRNRGHKKWGRFCGKHNKSSVFRDERVRLTDEQRVISKAATKERQRLLYAERARINEIKMAKKSLLPRVCSKCGETYPASHYIGRRGLVCETCKSSSGKEKFMIKKYGIDFKQYNSMVASQCGVCAICGVEPNGRPLVVDHCHDTDKVRGLLCDACNIGIGCLRDDLDILASASSYLINSRTKAVYYG